MIEMWDEIETEVTEEELAAIRDAAYNAEHPNSWTWNEGLVSWVPPIPSPVEEDKVYYWNEELLMWEEYNLTTD